MKSDDVFQITCNPLLPSVDYKLEELTICFSETVTQIAFENIYVGVNSSSRQHTCFIKQILPIFTKVKFINQRKSESEGDISESGSLGWSRHAANTQQSCALISPLTLAPWLIRTPCAFSDKITNIFFPQTNELHWKRNNKLFTGCMCNSVLY